MSIYYVSAQGCDKNDGLSQSTAWATIDKVNEAAVPGDKVLFRCGDTFYGLIRAPKGGTNPDTPTVYSSYGEGEKPVISQMKMPKAGAWEKVSENIYKIDFTDTSRYTGNTTDTNANAGYIKVDGKIYYHKVFTLEELKNRWDFYTDNSNNNVLYVWSEKAPDLISEDIQIACRTNGMFTAEYLEVRGLIFTGTGAHGISGSAGHVLISECEFHDIGGSRLDGYGKNTTRYGNGVEFWTNSNNITVENCKFSGIYDVAMTIQGNEVTRCWENMFFRGNIVWNCTQAFEIWTDGKLPETGIVNCRFENNVCIDSGYCWGYDARPDKGVAAHLLIYGLACPLCDVTVTGNVFSGAREHMIFKSDGFVAIPESYKIFGNTFLRTAGQELAWRHGGISDETTAEFERKMACLNRVVDIDYKAE